MPIVKTTPHIDCPAEKFAQTVIMPGDPRRSNYIAENFLSQAELINDVRGIQGYTGLYRGKRVSVMASGMGGPSMGIYSHELFAFMGVESIIRIGTCGGLHPKLHNGDLILAMGACYNTNFVSQFKLPGTFAPIADYELLSKAATYCQTNDVNYMVGNILTSDYFYDDSASTLDWAKLGVLGCEMETAILYTNAALFSKKALAMLTVSDELVSQKMMTPQERETTLNTMITAALELA